MLSPEMLAKGCAISAAYLQSLVAPDPGMLVSGLKFARQELKAAADAPLALDNRERLKHLYHLKMAELGDFARFPLTAPTTPWQNSTPPPRLSPISLTYLS